MILTGMTFNKKIRFGSENIKVLFKKKKCLIFSFVFNFLDPGHHGTRTGIDTWYIFYGVIRYF